MSEKAASPESVLQTSNSDTEIDRGLWAQSDSNSAEIREKLTAFRKLVPEEALEEFDNIRF